MQIRRYQPEDFEQILEIVRLETKVEPSEFEYRIYLSQQDKEHMVVEVDHQVVCLISLSDIEINGKRGLYFFAQMNPYFHGRGIGDHFYFFILQKMAEEYRKGRPILFLQACCHGDRPQLMKFFFKMGATVAHAYQTMMMSLEGFCRHIDFSPEYQVSLFNEEQDLEEYYELEREIFCDYFTYRPKSFSDFLAFVHSPSFQGSNTYLLRRKDKLIGFCQNQFVAPETCHVILLGIRQEYRGQGFGHNLMMYSLARARVKGAKEVMLAVDYDNEPALALYRHAGFRVVKQRFILEKAFDEAALLRELEEYGILILE